MARRIMLYSAADDLDPGTGLELVDADPEGEELELAVSLDGRAIALTVPVHVLEDLSRAIERFARDHQPKRGGLVRGRPR